MGIGCSIGQFTRGCHRATYTRTPTLIRTMNDLLSAGKENEGRPVDVFGERRVHGEF
jgi:hypothetical protein